MQQNQKIVSFKSYSVDRCIPYKKPLSLAALSNILQQKKMKKSSGELSSAVVPYTHTYVCREKLFFYFHMKVGFIYAILFQKNET